MLSADDFDARYKIDENGSYLMQLTFKPIIGQLTPDKGLSEKEVVEELMSKMGNAISKMAYGDLRSTLYQVCSLLVGDPAEKQVRDLIAKLNVSLDEVKPKKVEAVNGEKESGKKNHKENG